MSNVFTFTPQHELEHEKNLQEFIEQSRKLPPLNDKYDYDSNYWAGVGNFTNFGVSNQDRDPANVFDASLLPFAKAYVVYGKSSKAGLSVKFYALKAINVVCVKQYGFVDITKLTIGDFDQASQIARESIGAGAAYQAGRGLNNLLKFLIENKMVSPFTWKSPIKKPADNATGDEADEHRQKKMPDENALMALAKISAEKTEDLSPRDVFTTSTMTLLFSAPARGSEPLYLSADCLHSEEMKANRAMELGLAKEDIELLLQKQPSDGSDDTPSRFNYDDEITLKGLRWYSGKSYGHENKWLPTVMIDSVTTAVERLKAQSADARAFAKMLEESPDFPRHPLCPDVPEEQLLTKNEVALALGLDLSVYEKGQKLNGAVNPLLKRKGIERKDYVVRLRDLSKIVRSELPKGFPYVPFAKGEGKVKVKWSDSLFAGFANRFSSQKATIYTELTIPTINTLNEDLAPTKKKNRKTGELLTGTFSIFQRWDFGDLSLTSHQLRHMLDTMAAVNGMDGEMRAKWAMRSDPKHNRYYNHTTHEEYGSDFIEDRENELATQEQASSTQIQIQVATPRTIQELNTKASLTAHTTEFGMCVTSYLSEPCTKYRDCVNCNEHVCIKGDDGKCERIRQRLAREQKLLKQDKKAVDDGVQGAEQWYQRRKLTTERCEQLLEMMENPNIEDGALIKLANVEDVTQLDRALEANGKKRLPEIVNFKRVQSVSVEALIGKADVELPEMDDSVFDDLDDLDELDYMMEEEG
ncbi:integrase [Vibrio sp. F74]|uniref:integrase n=1 Tax=Vibrio sp. F74 TaxID=700020 RepID=UPI0035F54CEF